MSEEDATKDYCRYLSDRPNDYRIAIMDSSGSEKVFRVLGHPAEINPPVELVEGENQISADQITALKNQVLKFHFGIDDSLKDDSD